VAAQYLLALFVVWHKHANALNPPDMLAPMQESSLFASVFLAPYGASILGIVPLMKVNIF
jgi:hypothetical protein